MKDTVLKKWLNSMKDTIEGMEDHYCEDVNLALATIAESIDEALVSIDNAICMYEYEEEAKKSYNEILIEQNAELMGMNRL